MPLVDATVSVAAFTLATACFTLPPPIAPDALRREVTAPVGLQSVARSQSGGQTLGEVPPNMVSIPGGAFTMGISEKALTKWLEADPDTRNVAAHLLVACYPEHQETVGDLLVDKFETSNLQYKTWLDAHNKSPDPYTVKYNWTYFKNGTAIEGIPPGQEQHPVRAISCDEARACTHWLGKRLPTEPEWSYVATRGLKPDQAYPWGAAIGSWDPKKCANSSNSSRGPAGPQSFAPGTWKDDCTIDGIFDTCGNVGEWTISPFLAFPGFQPLEIGDKKNKKVLRGTFSAEFVAIRGGSYFGNHISNNNFWREGQHPGSRFEGVGFRGVMSAVPGLDALNEAQKMLTMFASDFKGRLDLSPQAVAGQVVQYHDPESGVGRGSKYLALTKVTSILAPLLKVEKDSIEKPVLLGILTVSTPIAKPSLPAGSYGIYFKGKGESAAQKLAKEEAKEAAKKAKPDDKPHPPKNGKGRAGKGADDAGEKGGETGNDDPPKDDKKKPDPKTRPGKAGGDKDGAKDDPPAPEGGEKKDGEKSAEELEAEAADAATKKAMEDAGLTSKEVSLVDIPTDRSVLLIKNEANVVVAVIDAKYVDGVAPHPTRFTYAAAPGGGAAAKTSSAKGDSGMIVAPHDSARFVFSVKMGTGTKFPEFDLELQFEAGSFEPVSAPAAAAAAPPSGK